MTTATVIKKADKTSDSSGKRGFICHTILFNCNCHSFDQVEHQLIKAIRCPLSRARAIAAKVHNTGSERVYTGPRERCEAVAMVLEDIGLVVKVSE